MLILINPDIYLKMILEQEGVPIATEDIPKTKIFIKQNETQVIISTKEDLLEEDQNDSQPVVIKYVFPDDTGFFRNLGVVDINYKCLIPKSATIGRTDKNTPFVYYNNTKMVLPLKLSGLLSHRASRLKQFYSKGKRYPFETVAVADRGGGRRLVANCLRNFLQNLQLPYCRLSYVPSGNRSLFGFRVDTDFSSVQEIANCVQIAHRYGMKWTWFIMTYNLSARMNALKEILNGQDIQVHCHEHKVYRDLKRNITNFSKALKLLKLLGIEPVGVAAPYGIWNENLNRAYGEIGFKYSSEFGYAYDDLPSRPVIDGQISSVIQIPVHPVAIGRLAWAKMPPSQMVEYYKRVIDLQVAREEPCFLYDHPSTIVRYSDVVNEIISYGLARCGNWLTMTDYWRWWRKRERVNYCVEFEKEEVVLATDCDDADISLVIEKDNMIAYLPLVSGRYQLQDLEWLPVSVLEFEREEINTGQFSVRVKCQNLIRSLQQRLR